MTLLPLNDPNSSTSPLVLDAEDRCIRGLDTPPLLAGEFALLAFLGSRAQKWHTTASLALHVYGREDASARQLVWKYASTLRKKLALAAPQLIQVCRRRGYSCSEAVTVAHDASLHTPALQVPGMTR